MRNRATLLFAAAASALLARPAFSAAPLSGDTVNGQKLYEAKCGGCHSLDMNRIGPMHRGVVGRAVATAPGYSYSNAIKKLGGTWTPQRLDKWLQGPQDMAPGAKMFFSVGSPTDRADIIAYLASTSAPPAKAK